MARGLRLSADASPLPLPDRDDLSGVELFLEESLDRETDLLYFLLWALCYRDVSGVRLRFAGRRGARYRLTLSALVHGLGREALPLEVDTWVERLPLRRARPAGP